MASTRSDEHTGESVADENDNERVVLAAENGAVSGPLLRDGQSALTEHQHACSSHQSVLLRCFMAPSVHGYTKRRSHECAKEGVHLLATDGHRRFSRGHWRRNHTNRWCAA